MSGALAPGKQWTVVAGVSIFTFLTIESPITRAVSSGFSVGASLSGENLFDVLIGMKERCFDRRIGRLTVTHCTRGFRLKANDQISLIDNIRNMVGIKLNCILPLKQQRGKVR